MNPNKYCIHIFAIVMKNFEMVNRECGLKKPKCFQFEIKFRSIQIVGLKLVTQCFFLEMNKQLTTDGRVIRSSLL